MFDAREEVIGWASAGAIASERVPDALRVAGVIPSAAQWRVFVERLLAWLGATLIAAALCYFVAANWHELGRYAKFAMVEAALVVAVAVACWQGLDALAGRVALFVAALVTGVLLALIGQVYQTGADAYELFAAWALFVLPWVIVGRQPALWLLWIALVDVAVLLLFRLNAARGIDALDLLFTTRAALWCVLAFNAAALALWEALAARRGGWLAERWAPRILAATVGAAVTFLVVDAIVGFSSRAAGPWAFAAYLAFTAAMYWAYRVRTRDLFMLAGLVLSAIVVIAFAFVRYLFHNDAAGGFLVTGLVVIACAAAGAYWLRRVGAQEP
jgi:uncharacterized membrane protein